MKRLRVLTGIVAFATALATGCTIYMDHDDPADDVPWGLPDAGSGGWPPDDGGGYHQDGGPGGCGQDATTPWPDASPCGCGQDAGPWPEQDAAGPWPDAGPWPELDGGVAPGYDATF